MYLSEPFTSLGRLGGALVWSFNDLLDGSGSRVGRWPALGAPVWRVGRWLALADCCGGLMRGDGSRWRVGRWFGLADCGGGLMWGDGSRWRVGRWFGLAKSWSVVQ
ncbi:hypothetical protein [Arthrobacter sp. 260]|uniref:hypothetical protein n=1 Tax=Arthrobacter sp. 260 TaxID=2735314 RepID=UPI0014928ECD|nr:hypothetical protein [Arthrobacter sp. 260]NOJ59503.1 hypothetical protein [Arthrobacter sp. 260]